MTGDPYCARCNGTDVVPAVSERDVMWPHVRGVRTAQHPDGRPLMICADPCHTVCTCGRPLDATVHHDDTPEGNQQCPTCCTTCQEDE